MSKLSSFPPVYNDAFQAASENLRQALPLINKHQTPINPVNYAVWYEYVSGQNQDLINAIDTRLAKGETVTQALTQYLYERYVLLGMPERISQTNNGLKLVVDNTLSKISRAEIAASHYANDFSQTQHRLQDCADIDDLKAIVAGVVETTRKLSTTSSELQQELAQSNQEILKLRAELESVKQSARTDSLTGLLNRGAFNKALTELCNEGTAHSVLVLFDIDHFKQINDRFGHLLGDSVLQYFASILKQHCDDVHVAARVGGEEMAMLLSHTTQQQALDIAESIRAQFARSRLQKKGSDESIGQVTVSIGISLLKPGDTPSSWLERADQALYRSKGNGRDTVSLL